MPRIFGPSTLYLPHDSVPPHRQLHHPHSCGLLQRRIMESAVPGQRVHHVDTWCFGNGGTRNWV